METETVDKPTWLSAKEAALYVGLKAKNSYKYMLLLARAGKIKAGYDGRTFRFRTGDLDSWLCLNWQKVAGKKRAA